MSLSLQQTASLWVYGVFDTTAMMVLGDYPGNLQSSRLEVE